MTAKLTTHSAPYLFSILILITIAIFLSVKVYLLNLLVTKPILYTPHTVGNFNQLDCAMLLRNGLGGSSYNPTVNRMEILATTDNSDTAVLAKELQYAKIRRLDGKKLEIQMLGNMNYTSWDIIEESEEGIIASNNTGGSFSISKKGGLAVYSTVQYMPRATTPSAGQEGFIFSCKSIN